MRFRKEANGVAIGKISGILFWSFPFKTCEKCVYLHKFSRNMKIKEVIHALEMFAPLPLQDGFDNAGLQVGLTDAEVTGALLCLDVTEAVVDEAIAMKCNLIVSHHPLIFKGYKSITGKDYVERCIMKAIGNGITIYSMHTNMDNAPQGVNAKMAEKLGLVRTHILDPKAESLLKLVTFVPTAQAPEVREALFAAGCGNIGNYDSCSYNLAGTGTFRAGEGTHPFCGEQGELHKEEEVRIETILPSWLRRSVENALVKAHPYEEPAYDFYPLKNDWQQAGSGLIGELPEPQPEEEFLQKVKEVFRTGCVQHSRFSGREIHTVALCGGAGAFLLPRAVAQKADVFITGEVKYHDYFFYEDQILVAAIGHYESEQYTQEIFKSIIRDLSPDIPVRMTRTDTNPVKYL